MDKAIRVNFYQAINVTPAQPGLFDVITTCGSMIDVEQYVELHQGVKVRIERVNSSGQYLTGELVRQQTDNLPAIARGAAPLEPNNTPLGHRVAFRYRPDINVIAMEANRTGVSPARFASFLKARMRGHTGFYFDPCLTADALAQLRNGTPRKIQMRVAVPEDLRMMEGGPMDIEDSIENLRSIVDGRVVTLEIGIDRGDRAGVLNLEGILSIFRWGSQNRGHVKKLTVQTAEEDVPIDLFGQQIIETGNLDLDNNDIGQSYQIRHDFLAAAFDKRLGELQNLFAPTQRP